MRYFPLIISFLLMVLSAELGTIANERGFGFIVVGLLSWITFEKSYSFLKRRKEGT